MCYKYIRLAIPALIKMFNSKCTVFGETILKLNIKDTKFSIYKDKMYNVVKCNNQKLLHKLNLSHTLSQIEYFLIQI